MIPIVPALIPTSEHHLRTTLGAVGFSREVHVDIIDGVFAGQPSWPYSPAGAPKDTQKLTDQFTLEVDLMVDNPLPAAVEWLVAGADMLVFHVETISKDNFANFAEFTHVSLSVSAHGDTPLEMLLEYAEHADCIQLMGISDIGAHGLPFDATVYDKIKLVKERFPRKPVTVDGHVTADNIVQLAEAGADRFVVGSAITLQADPQVAHASLAELLTNI